MLLVPDLEVPPWVLLFIISCLILAVFFLEYLRKIALQNENIHQHENDNALVECSSPHCVRCNKTQSVLRCAQQRLSECTESNDDSNKEALVKDIEQSLTRINKPSSEDGIENSLAIKTSTPNVLFIRGLREISIFSPSEFAGIEVLINNYQQIRLEFNNLYKSPLPETKILWKTNSTDSGTWEIAQLIDQGSRTKASTLCPLTMSSLSQLSSIMDANLFGNAAFSVVHPQTFIERHCGSTNCRIRCHLGLHIPNNVCSLEVDDTLHKWREGQVLCFNDAFPHSVSHHGGLNSGLRVILMVDLWHPDVTESQRKMIDFAFHHEKL